MYHRGVLCEPISKFVLSYCFVFLETDNCSKSRIAFITVFIVTNPEE